MRDIDVIMERDDSEAYRFLAFLKEQGWTFTQSAGFTTASFGNAQRVNFLTIAQYDIKHGAITRYVTDMVMESVQRKVSEEASSNSLSMEKIDKAEEVERIRLEEECLAEEEERLRLQAELEKVSEDDEELEQIGDEDIDKELASVGTQDKVRTPPPFPNRTKEK